MIKYSHNLKTLPADVALSQFCGFFTYGFFTKALETRGWFTVHRSEDQSRTSGSSRSATSSKVWPAKLMFFVHFKSARRHTLAFIYYTEYYCYIVKINTTQIIFIQREAERHFRTSLSTGDQSPWTRRSLHFMQFETFCSQLKRQ